MGDMADDLMFRGLNEELRYEHYIKEGIEEGKEHLNRYYVGICFWTDKNKNETLVQKLGDNYLKNLLNYVSKREEHGANEYWKKIFRYEIEKREVNS